jgi:uncharacterized protein
MISITLETARRFILGKQGLWPGRRWRGLAGVEQAMRAIEYLQLDPLNIIARSQDITLHSRVLDYVPGMWEEVTYGQRMFFDWGGWLAVRPMDELPHWRVVMRRERERSERLGETTSEHAAVVAEMRALLRERGTVTNREAALTSRTQPDTSRGRKDSANALSYLWRIGDVMTHQRKNFERVYALTEAVAPAHLIRESDNAAADRFLITKEVSFFGLSRLSSKADAFFRGVPFGDAAPSLAGMVADGDLIEVRVEGWKAVHYALASDAGRLAEIAAGRVPVEWAPLEGGTDAEVVFLAPLDQVSARGRAKTIFGFDYVWEVYKPADKRTYGYYTLPVLWGDRLVARFDSKLDRTANRFVLLGFWLEDPTLAGDGAFAEALARGFARFVTFLGAEALDAAAIREPLLRQRVAGM